MIFFYFIISLTVGRFRAAVQQIYWLRRPRIWMDFREFHYRQIKCFTAVCRWHLEQNLNG